MNLFPGVTAILDKGVDILTRVAESNRKDAELQDKIAAILADPDLRGKLNRIIADASFLGLDVVARVQDAADTPPAPTTRREARKPEPKPEPKAEDPNDVFTDLFGKVAEFNGFHAINLGEVDPNSDIGHILQGLIEQLEGKDRKRNDDLPPF